MGISLKKPEGVPGKSWPAIMIGMFVAFGGVLFGYDTGTISGIIAMPYVSFLHTRLYLTAVQILAQAILNWLRSRR